MAWTTVYISGKSDFRQDVRRKLQHSNLPHMPGFMEARHGAWFNDLYWLDGTVDLRKFKETVSAKLIWKHRLHFFTLPKYYVALMMHFNYKIWFLVLLPIFISR